MRASDTVAGGDRDWSSFSSQERLLLGAIVLLGAALRVAYQVDRPFRGDEIGTLAHIARSYTYLLTHSTTWLTMNYFLVAEKLLPRSSGRPPSCSPPFHSRAASRPSPSSLWWHEPGSPPPSIGAAFLAAVNPYLIERSVQIRSYAPLVAFSLLLVLAFLAWVRRPGWRAGIAFAAASILLVLAHPNGVFPIAAVGIAAAASWVAELRRARCRGDRIDIVRRAATLGIPTLGAAAVVAGAYSPFIAEMTASVAVMRDTPPTSLDYLSYTWSRWFAPGFWGWPAAALALLGLHRAASDPRTDCRVPVAIVLLAPAFLALQGASHFPWASARWLVFALPFLLIFVAWGIWAVVPSGTRRAPALALSLIVAATWLPEMENLFAEKRRYPWNELRRHLRAESVRGDVVVGLEHRIAHYLGPFANPEPFVALGPQGLDRLADGSGRPSRVFLVMSGVPVAEGAGARRFGRLTVVPYEFSNARELLLRIRTDLAAAVEPGLPTEGRYEPIYAALLRIDTLLDRRGDAEKYAELRAAAAWRTPQDRWRTRKMRKGAAERVARSWRERSAQGPPDT